MPSTATPLPQPFSARGVAGEVNDVVKKHGAHVPNYDIFGQQHYRLPVKDKISSLATEPLDQFTREPRYKTRTELLTVRRDAKHPHISYDIDGDGAVGPTDYFLGKLFGKEQDHRLNTGEQQKLVKALEGGLLDHFSFGHEQFGVLRPFPVQQKRGKIVTVDNAGELNEVYGPHWNANKEPNHPTLTHLKNHRKAEMKNTAQLMKEEHAAKNPAFAPEPPVHQEFLVAEPPITHIAQRKEAMRQHARESAGLHPINASVNPHKEDLEVGMNHIEKPAIATRSHLMDKRNAQRLEDLHNARELAEKDYIPGNARHTALDATEYDMRRPKPEALTMTRLRQKRKQDFVEHNLSNFGYQLNEYNRYSALTEPWHTLQEDYVHDPPSCALKELNEPPHRAEASLKVGTHPVHNLPKQDKLVAEIAAGCRTTADDVVQDVPVAHTGLGARTIKRWSAEFTPAVLDSQAPRLFDGVKQAPTLSTDAAPMHVFSTFEPIKRDGVLKDAARKQKTVMEDTERAQQWRLTAYGNVSSVGPTSQGAPPPRAESPKNYRMSSPSPGSNVSRTSSRQPKPGRRGASPAPIDEEPVQFRSEDPSMTDRLTRLVAPKSPRADKAVARAESVATSIGQTARQGSLGRFGGTTYPTPRGGGNSATPRSNRGRDGGSATPGGATPRVPCPAPPAPLAVRASGFQWLDQTAFERMATQGGQQLSRATLERFTPRGSDS